MPTQSTSKKDKQKLSWYTWQSGSFSNHVKAKNMIHAAQKAVKQLLEDEEKEKQVRFDILIKKGRWEVY